MFDEMASNICQALPADTPHVAPIQVPARQGLADIARHVIDTHFEHLFLEFNGML